VLRELHIRGLGVIADLSLEFDPGLNVLTGETGAGKTMVTVGLALALGRRAAAMLVREGERAARVQARFDAPATAGGAEWSEDGEVVLARSVGADGRSSARIGGQLTSVSSLADLGDELVEIHGQNQGAGLLASVSHAAFLDRFAGEDHAARVVAYRETWNRHRRTGERLAELDRLARDQEREADLLRYQIREIEGAGIGIGEIGELEAEERRLGDAERLIERAMDAETAAAADDGAADTSRRTVAALAEAAATDDRDVTLLERARPLAEEALELARDLRSYREGIVVDPGRLERVRNRIQAVKGLQRKYGDTEGDVLSFMDEARARLSALQSLDSERRRLEGEAAALDSELARSAEPISRAREETAPMLEAALLAELGELGMAGAEIHARLVPLAQAGQAGRERCELLFAGGPGQVPMPLAKVASGGELSRTMLACRSVLADLDDVPTLVFDEVDAGIGGRAAVAVGRRLARLAGTRQVLVVTHLPQIAAFADRHIRVDKRNGIARVEVLDESGRVRELSRMLSGLPGSDAAATHAEELLAEAGRRRDAS